MAMMLTLVSKINTIIELYFGIETYKVDSLILVKDLVKPAR